MQSRLLNSTVTFQPEDATGQLDYRYDEFGFKVEEEGAYIISDS